MVSKLIDYAETTSHAFLGEDRNNPRSHTTAEKVVSHVVGYAASPLRYGMEYAINKIAPKMVRPPLIKHGGNARSVAAAPPPIEKMASKSKKGSAKAARFRTKMVAKKAARREVKKDIKKIPFINYSRPAGPALPRRLKGKKIVVSNGQRLVQRVHRPPVTTRYELNPGSSMVFMPARMPGCVRMVGKMRIGSFVGHDAATGLNVMQVNNDMDGVNTNYTYKTIYINAPFNILSTTPTMQSFVTNFQKYHIRTRLEYVPACPYTTPGSVQVGYLDDPWALVNNLKAHNYVAATNNSPNFKATTLATIANLREFPVTSRWKSRWRFNKGLFNMTGEISYNAAIEAGLATTGPQYWEPEQVRQQVAGMWVFAPNAPPPASLVGTADFIYGDWFVYFDLELCNIIAPADVPYTGSSSLSTSSSSTSSYAGKTASSLLAKEALTLLDLCSEFKRMNPPRQQVEEKEEKKSVLDILAPRSRSKERTEIK